LRIRGGGPGEVHSFEFGWIHLGDEFVEFQLDPPSRPEAADLEEFAPIPDPERFLGSLPVTLSRRDDPMWDRWLDG